MASIERLRIVSLRNVDRVDVCLPPGMIWITGANGAGKTTILEAVYVLSRGVSFRGRRHGPLVTRGQAGGRIEGRIRSVEGSDRRTWTSASGHGGAGDRAKFRVRLIGSAMQALIEGEPQLRRRFIDWNVFHVEPAAVGWWTRFRRVSAQRNAWLRAGAPGPPIWNEEYASLVTLIANARARFFSDLSRELAVLLQEFPSVADASPQWRAELPAEGAATAMLREQLSGDIERGYSYLSPARADFAFFRAGQRWVGSRGQNKLLGMLIQLAAERCFPRADGDKPIWLVDDPGAELDAETQDAVLPLVLGAGDQVLVASLSAPSPEVSRACEPALFHVEHGTLHGS